MSRLLPAAALAALAAPASAQSAIELRILATSDIHMALVDYDYTLDRPDPGTGLNRVAALIAEARAEKANTLLVDNGDLIQGGPMGDVAARDLKPGEMHPVILAMNPLRYDAAVLGNHEFNFGLDFARRAYEGATFPVLAGNVLTLDAAGQPGAPLFPAEVLLKRTLTDQAGNAHTVDVGVVGVLTPQIMIWDKEKLTGRVTTVDQVAVATSAARSLRAAGADVVVVLSHGGLSAQPYAEGQENAAAQLATIPDVDAVVSGHSHRVFPGPDYENFPNADLAAGTVAGTPVVMPGAYGSHLGVIDLVLEGAGDAWRVVAGKAEARPVEVREGDAPARPRLEADAAVTAALATWHERTLTYIREPIGTLAAPVSTYRVLLGDTSALGLVAAAQTAYARDLVKGTPHEGLPILSAAAPFRAGGRPGPDNYTALAAGPLAIKNVADLYQYPNVLTVVKLTGAEVREYLEKSARIFNTIDPAKAEPQPLIAPQPAYNFDVLFGLTYTIDVTQPSRYGREATPENPDARRIRDVMIDGAPLDDAASYLVVTNNYRANGGGAFPGLDGSKTVLTAPDLNRDAVIRWVLAQGTVTPVTTPVWRFAPVAGTPDIRIEIGPGGRAEIAADPRLALVGTTERGFDEYRVNLGTP